MTFTSEFKSQYLIGSRIKKEDRRSNKSDSQWGRDNEAGRFGSILITGK